LRAHQKNLKPGTVLIPFLLLFAALFSFSPGVRAASDGLSAAQKKEVEQVVRDYLKRNPEVLLDSIQALRQKEEAQARQAVAQNLKALKKDLEDNPGSPVGGNPTGDVTIVEFFDYRCPYCKKVFPSVQELLNEDRNVRYVFKEFPILGPVSVAASEAAVAGWYQDNSKYMTLHARLMNDKGSLSKDEVLLYAGTAGYDVDKIEKAMKSPEVQAELRKNARMAQALNITGTPAFIIGGQIIPGAISIQEMKDLVKTARQRKKS